VPVNARGEESPEAILDTYLIAKTHGRLFEHTSAFAGNVVLDCIGALFVDDSGTYDEFLVGEASECGVEGTALGGPAAEASLEFLQNHVPVGRTLTEQDEDQKLDWADRGFAGLDPVFRVEPHYVAP
jgi:hypothetical protein